jgi:hypothetical protein
MPTSHKPASPTVEVIRKEFARIGGFKNFLDKHGRIYTDIARMYIIPPFNLNEYLFGDVNIPVKNPPCDVLLILKELHVGQQRYLAVVYQQAFDHYEEIIGPTKYEDVVRV